jgi:hypothetical protein
MRFQGANRVRSSMATENISPSVTNLFLQSSTVSAQPGPYHHLTNSSISIIRSIVPPLVRCRVSKADVKEIVAWIADFAFCNSLR